VLGQTPPLFLSHHSSLCSHLVPACPLPLRRLLALCQFMSLKCPALTAWCVADPDRPKNDKATILGTALMVLHRIAGGSGEAAGERTGPSARRPKRSGKGPCSLCPLQFVGPLPPLPSREAAQAIVRQSPNLSSAVSKERGCCSSVSMRWVAAGAREDRTQRRRAPPLRSDVRALEAQAQGMSPNPPSSALLHRSPCA